MSNHFKNAKVVMLPTNKKATSEILLGVVPNLAVKTKEVLDDVSDWMLHGKPQHLYFISDDKIRVDGDWYYNTITNAVFKMKYLTAYNPDQDKKIIATTDTSLLIPFDDVTIGLPQPSQQFITKFIEEYNKGNIITDVMVEYNEYNRSTTWEYDEPEISEVKVNPKDNTVTIKKIKDNWNREEFITILNKFGSDVYSDYTKNKTMENFTNDWVYKNL